MSHSGDIAMDFQNRSTWATLPRTQRGMPLVLGGDPKGRSFLYTNGNSVIIRNIANPCYSDIYTEHSVSTTVAKYSPSGNYIASADVSGKVRIWDTTQMEHILKNEYQPFVGPIKDLSWSPDNQRIVVVGEGRERFGHVFLADTGTSVGEIAGHSGLINSCDYRPTRPYRIVTASEDHSVGIYEGPPFKFKSTLNDHTRFVQCVRFNRNGYQFASGGFDGKMILYSGDTYTKVGEFGPPAHGGGIYSLSWSPCGGKILSASGDKTCKLWDAETLSLISTFTFGDDVLDQQMSCLWQDPYVLSVSLSGFINYLDIHNPDKPIRVVKGHNKSITALGLSKDRTTIYTGSHDGYVTHWDAETGSQDRVKGSHSNQVQDMAASANCMFTCGLDDTVRAVNCLEQAYEPNFFKLDCQPRGICTGRDGTVYVAALMEICGIKDGIRISVLGVMYEPSCVSLKISEKQLAVGGTLDKAVHIYELMDLALHETEVLHQRGSITDVAYSPSGQYLACCDNNRKVVLYNADTYDPAHNLDWCFHTARVNCLAWAPTSRYLASGSLDTNIIVWDVEHPSKHMIIKKAHPMSQITCVVWVDSSTIVSTGQDGNVKMWEVKK